MKKILIFKTCGDWVAYSSLDKLIVNTEDEIHCFIQSGSYEKYSAKYPQIRFIDIRSNIFDNPEIFRFDDIDKIRFDEIYFLATGVYFQNYRNILEIAENIKADKWIFCNGKGHIKEVKRHSKFYETMRLWFGKMLFNIFRFTYRLKYIGKDY